MGHKQTGTPNPKPSRFTRIICCFGIIAGCLVLAGSITLVISSLVSPVKMSWSMPVSRLLFLCITISLGSGMIAVWWALREGKAASWGLVLWINLVLLLLSPSLIWQHDPPISFIEALCIICPVLAILLIDSIDKWKHESMSVEPENMSLTTGKTTTAISIFFLLWAIGFACWSWNAQRIAPGLAESREKKALTIAGKITTLDDKELENLDALVSVSQYQLRIMGLPICGPGENFVDLSLDKVKNRHGKFVDISTLGWGDAWFYMLAVRSGYYQAKKSFTEQGAAKIQPAKISKRELNAEVAFVPAFTLESHAEAAASGYFYASLCVIISVLITLYTALKRRRIKTI